MRRIQARLLLMLLLCGGIVYAQAAPQGQDDDEADPFSMDLDSLANTKVVTASKFPEKISDAPSVITVVSRDELRRFGGVTLREILGRVSGLTITTSFFGDSGMVAARGDQTRSDQGHILILINGRPTREVLEGGIGGDILESFPVNVLERIEVVKGPGSVLYGSDAFSGVINLITQKAEGTGYHIMASRGPAGEAATSAQAFFARGSFNLVAAGQYSQEPHWNTLVHSNDVAFRYNSERVATLRHSGEGGYLGINYKGFSFSSLYTGVEAPSFFQQLIGTERWKRGFFDIGYALKANANWDMNFNVTYTRTLLDTADFPNINRDSHETTFEWTNFIRFSDADHLTMGALFNRTRGREDYLGGDQAVTSTPGFRSSSAVYGQYEHKLTDEINLIGGFQAIKIGPLGWKVVPRAGVLWNATGHVTLKTLFGSAFRAPSINERESDHPFLKGNSNLDPESVNTLDVQAAYQSNRLQLTLDFFHSRQSNLIVLRPSVEFSTYGNRNTAVSFQGTEAEGKFYLNKQWFAQGSLLYQTSSSADPFSEPVPALGVKAGVSYKVQDGVEFSVFDVYRGYLPNYASASNLRPDAFHTVSAHFRYDLTKRWMRSSGGFSRADKSGVALVAHGDNLLNHPIWLPNLSGLVHDTIPFMQGRTIYVGIEVWQKKE